MNGASRTLLFFFLFSWSMPAFAGEEDLILTGQLDYHRLFEEGGRNGVGLAAELGYGINDTFGVAMQVKQAFILTNSDNQFATQRFFAAGVGLTVTLDVLRVVPMVNVSPSVFRFADAQGGVQTLFGAQLGLSFDYLLTRRVQVGMVGGYQYRASAQGIDTRPDSFFAGLRGGAIFSL